MSQSLAPRAFLKTEAGNRSAASDPNQSESSSRRLTLASICACVVLMLALNCQLSRVSREFEMKCEAVFC